MVWKSPRKSHFWYRYMRSTLNSNPTISDRICFLLRVSSHDFDDNRNLQENIFQICLRAIFSAFKPESYFYDDFSDLVHHCNVMPAMMLRHPLWRWSKANISLLADGLDKAPDDFLFKTFSEEPLIAITTDGNYITLNGTKRRERNAQGDFLTILKSITFPDDIIFEVNKLIESIDNRLQYCRQCWLSQTSEILRMTFFR